MTRLWAALRHWIAAWFTAWLIFTITAPSTNSDGSRLTDLAGIRIYCGSAAGRYTRTQTIPFTTAGGMLKYTDADVLVPKRAITYCAATAYDVSGNESGFSGEVRVDRLAPGMVR